MREIKMINISEPAREVLSRSIITSDSVKLPEQLDRKLYVEIDRVFKAAGGKWNRGRGVHLFSLDPRMVLGLAVDTGAIVDTKKTMQQFFTPAPIADLMVERAELFDGANVLEPSAGQGAILDAIQRVCVPRGWACECTAVELDVALAQFLCRPQRLASFVAQRDFLLLTPNELGHFDRVLMNPPFTGGQDIAHIQHALAFVKPFGRLVAICADGPRQREELRSLASTWEELPPGTFSESGTNVRTALLMINT